MEILKYIVLEVPSIIDGMEQQIMHLKTHAMVTLMLLVGWKYGPITSLSPVGKRLFERVLKHFPTNALHVKKQIPYALLLLNRGSSLPI